MDLEDLKRILQKDKGKIIIVENGKPVMIILPYEDQGLKSSSEETFEPPLEDEEIGGGPAELTIDDLPL